MPKLNFERFLKLLQLKQIQIKSADRFYNKAISEKQRIKKCTISELKNFKSNPFKSLKMIQMKNAEWNRKIKRRSAKY
jgi:hypothetical protein